MSGLILLVAADSIFITDIIKMLFTLISEKYLNRREKRGRAEGSAEERKRWVGWNERRLDAESKGEEFTEPPPSRLMDDGNG